MNNKIKELSNQLFSMEEFEYAEEFLNDEFMKKFAELVVKECLKEINDMIVDESEQLYSNNKQTTESVNERLMDAHDNIVDLFGIE